jgi:hypothetical protein
MARINIGFTRVRRDSRAALLTSLACVLAVFVLLVPLAALAASNTTRTDTALGIPIPASARVRGTISTSTTAGASTTHAKSTSATSTPASTAAAGGAQPGTVAPTSTTLTHTTATAPTTTAATTPVNTTTSGTLTTTNAGTATPSGTVVVGVHKAKPKSTRLSTGALVLAVLGALLVLACIVWVLARWLALEPRWTVSLMYSLREASSRVSATWAEFSDWVRLGH